MFPVFFRDDVIKMNIEGNIINLYVCGFFSYSSHDSSTKLLIFIHLIDLNIKGCKKIHPPDERQCLFSYIHLKL